MLNFEELNLNQALLNALSDLEYIHPTPIQEKAFPVIMSGSDVIGVAQTGTGKTFAYLLPILRQMKFSPQKHPRAIVLVPTRELVVQVVNEIEKLTKYITLRYGGIYGGSNINPQKQLVFDGLDILVATPGRLIDLASIGALKLKGVQQLVIDEVDEMLDQGFRAQLTTILDLLPKHQNILFSATLTDEVEKLIHTFFTNPTKIEIAAHGTPLLKIAQSSYLVPNYNTKVNLLTHLLSTDKSISKVLVFAASIKMADRLFDDLISKFSQEVMVIHSAKSQTVRFSTLKKFDEGKIRILIATDIAARGLDIADVSHVINFDTPASPGDYLHRIGRTGRAGKDGLAITFTNEVEEEYKHHIEELMKMEIPIVEIPKEVVISTVFAADEKPEVGAKNYLKLKKNKNANPSFHVKKDKNRKENLGGPRKRNPNKTKPRNRAVERNRAKKRSS
jgi:ATP-dependent RNA helicase RhlE